MKIINKFRAVIHTIRTAMNPDNHYEYDKEVGVWWWVYRPKK